MKRRQLLFGIGSVAGTGGIIGTGAFTSVSADRDVTVAVADDADGYLGLVPSSGPNGAFATTATDDTLALAFSSTTAGGDGLGTDSVYDFDDVFEVTNQGTQPIYVWATFAGGVGGFQTGGNDTDVWLYPNGDPGDKLRDSSDDALYLGVGKAAAIGVHVDTDELDQDQTLTMTVNADVANPNSTNGSVVDGSGTTIPGPTDGLVSYWPLDGVGDGTIEDVVANSTGSTTGGGVTAASSGKVGGAVAFDTSDEYIQFDQLPGVTPPFSLSIWLNAFGFDQAEYPLAVSKWQRAQNRDYLIGYHGPEDKLYAQFNREPDGNKTTLFGPSPSTDRWYHCVLTYAEDETGRFYVDGTEVDSGTGPFDNTVSKLVIGSKDGGGNPWHGRVDDVRLYTRALSDAEVTELFNIGQE